MNVLALGKHILNTIKSTCIILHTLEDDINYEHCLIASDDDKAYIKPESSDTLDVRTFQANTDNMTSPMLLSMSLPVHVVS